MGEMVSANIDPGSRAKDDWSSPNCCWKVVACFRRHKMACLGFLATFRPFSLPAGGIFTMVSCFVDCSPGRNDTLA